MKFYNVTAVPTISSAEGTYYVKDANGYVQEYLVTGGLVKYIGGYPMQNKGTDVEKPMSQKATTDELNTKALKATLINAGAGLTGGGTLEQDRTLDIVSANDGITVNADNIQLNTQDILNGTSTTKPLSAKQGAELNNRINMYGTAGGTAQDITLTVSASITLSAGMRFTFKPIANNTATNPTVNINNLGAKTILRGINAAASAALIANDIVQNIDAILEYDGTNFRLLNPQTGGIVQTTGTDTDKVMSQKAVTDAIANSMWYGIEYDTTISTPTCTRIGNIELHKSLPIQSRMKGCLLDDNGNVVEYLNPTDWTGNVRDGSRGQVMVELPMHYIKFETEGTKRRVKISEWAISGFTQIKKQYVSAYQATVDRSVSETPKLCSIVNEGTSYRGGNNNASYDGKSNTLLGRPASNISRTNFRIYARNRNSGDTEWNCMTYGIQKELYWLFAVEYATLNSQAAFNAEKTSEGYRQGGLGDGVSTLDYNKLNTFNGNNPFIPCGYTDELGNGTGYVEFTMPTEYDSTTTKKVQVPRYRGIENPFGHIWQWTDGINVQIQAGDTGKSNIYTCDDPSKFNDSNYDGYNLIGQEARTGGYVKKIVFGEYGDIMATEVGGSNTTYYCDYHYTNIPAADTLRGVHFGGNANGGTACGFVYATSHFAPSIASALIGSRLCFIPRTA